MMSWRTHILMIVAMMMTVVSPALAADAPTRAQTLVVGTMWEALPLKMGARRSRFYNESEILDTLVKLDYDMKLVSGLATKWVHVSPKLWRFTLRQNVIFQDGTPLTAEAVRNSLQHVIALLPYAADLLEISAIRVDGPLEFEIETKEPFAALPNQLTDAITGIYAPSSFDRDGKFVKPVGTGPWKLVKYIKQDRTIVDRFDGYWGKRPSLKRIVYRYIPDHNARELALETGEIDFADNLPPSDVARLKADSAFKVYTKPVAGLFYGAFNTAGATPLSDRRVRLALNFLVDRKLVVKAALDGIGQPAWQFFNPRFSWVPKGIHAYSFDPEKAASLLDEAGYSKVGGKWQKDGKPLTLRIVSYTSRTEMEPITEALSALLNNAGIATKVQMFTWEGMLERVRARQYDISVVFWTPEMTANPDMHLTSQFYSTAEMNYQGWANKRFDALVDKGRTLDPGQEWTDTYRKALNILQDDAPELPLVHKVFVAASSAKVVGYRIHPSGFFYDFKSVSKTQ